MSTLTYVFRPILFSMTLTLLFSCGGGAGVAHSETANKKEDTIPINNTSNLPPVDTSSMREISEDESAKDINKTKSAKSATQSKTIHSDYSALPGPKGYIIIDKAELRAEPKLKAKKVATLKLDEMVYLLETTMRNEAGEITDYPTWYEVINDKQQRGWIQAKSANFGGGG